MPAHPGPTPQQSDRLDAETALILATWPDPDAFEARTAALETAIQYLLNERTPATVAAELVAARQALSLATVRAKWYAAMLTRDGMSEEKAGQALGISRDTLRAVLGKKPGRDSRPGPDSHV